MPFTIQIDYRFDSTGFFDVAERRQALEEAVAAWEALIFDEFDDIPVGTTLDIRNPSTDASETVVLTEAVDDVIIFVGATNFTDNTLGLAGPDGVNAEGDIYAARIASNYRGTGPVTDFEPWAGTITFDTDTKWYYGNGQQGPTQSNFISVAMHEIAHVLGFGTSGAFDRWIVNDVFTGPNARSVNNGQGIPLQPDRAHIQEGFDNNNALLDPTLTIGDAVDISVYDLALLADIGYEIAGYTAQGSTPDIATNGNERIFGTELDDTINGLDGNDTLQGSSGDDDLSGGPGSDVLFGQEGVDTFVIHAGDGENTISDFDLTTETIRLVDSGFASAADAANAVTKIASNVSQLTLDDGTTVDIFHTSQSGTPLTAAHFEIAGDAPTDPPADPPTQPKPNSDPTGEVRIIGTLQVGETLSVDTSALADEDGLGEFIYQWLRDGVELGDEYDPTYTLTQFDQGARMQVEVSYVDGGHTYEVLFSDFSQPVAAAPGTPDIGDPTPPPTGNPTPPPASDPTPPPTDNDNTPPAPGPAAPGPSGPTTDGTNNMNGDDADNVLTGTGADESISGNAGNDTLSGGGGNDTLTGGIGFDTFRVDPGDGQVEITDFTYFSDKLDLLSFQRADVALALSNAEGTNNATLRFSDGTVLIIDGDGVNAGNIDLAEVLVSGSNRAPEGELEITGTQEVGSTLQVDIRAISDLDVIQRDTVNIVWLRDGAVIPGATGETYDVTEDDIGADITVRLSYFDAFGKFETVESPSSSPDPDPDGDGGDDPDGGDEPGSGDDDDGGETPPEEPEEPEEPEIPDSVNDTDTKATPFNDVFSARPGMDVVDGGDGVDTIVFIGSQSHYTVEVSATSVSVTDRREDGVGTFELHNIERVGFEFGTTYESVTLTLPQLGSGAALSEEDFENFIEMYIAYFNRAPDAIGLGFWGAAFANGTSLEEMARLFVDQDETRDLYPDGTSSVRFVADVYDNVLGRAPDLEGLQFWRAVLDNGTVSRDAFILEILRGVDAAPDASLGESFVTQQLLDQEFLQMKTDVGALYAVHRGLTDVIEAANIMALVDGSDAGLQAAIDAIDAAHSAALSDEGGAFLMPIVGFLDDPFAA